MSDDDLFGFLCETDDVAKALAAERTSDPTYEPAKEGVDHINAYSKSRTRLGRMLSNFARTPFTCDDGSFASIEAYWYWLKCDGHPERETLRSLHGYHAKKAGRELGEAESWHDVEDFQIKICRAIEAKVRQNGEVRDALLRSSLPIIHYYVTKDGKVIRTSGDAWVWRFMESLRTRLQGEAG